MSENHTTTTHSSLLIISNDVVDLKMAGVGLRYLEIAKAIAPFIKVSIASPKITDKPSNSIVELDGIQVYSYSLDESNSINQLAKSHDILLFSSFILEKYPFLADPGKRIIIDLYDPQVLENLFYYLEQPLDIQMIQNQKGVEITNRLAQVGDFFICGNERQRDYWLGVLTANSRVNPLNYKIDPTLRSLIDVVGVGLPDHDPVLSSSFRGQNPMIPEDSRIVLWGGGIWNWLDPLSLIHAWPIILEKYPKARLVFLGTRHPNPLVPAHEIVSKAMRLAEEIGQKDQTIIFMEWLSLSDRESLLVEADIGVLLQPFHVETHFSIRTRVLDYIWARLPILITKGDVTSEWVENYKIGRTVPPNDIQAVADAVIELFSFPKHAWSQSFDPLREAYHWSRVILPLKKFCLEGNASPDRLNSAGVFPHRIGRMPWSYAFSRSKQIIQQNGAGTLAARAIAYLKLRISRTLRTR